MTSLGRATNYYALPGAAQQPALPFPIGGVEPTRELRVGAITRQGSNLQYGSTPVLMTATQTGNHLITGQLITADISMERLGFALVRAGGQVEPIQVNDNVDADQFSFAFQVYMEAGERFAIFMDNPQNILGGTATIPVAVANQAASGPYPTMTAAQCLIQLRFMD